MHDRDDQESDMAEQVKCSLYDCECERLRAMFRKLDDEIVPHALGLTDKRTLVEKLGALCSSKAEEKAALATSVIRCMIDSSDADALLGHIYILNSLSVEQQTLNDQLVTLEAIPRLLMLAQADANSDIQYWACSMLCCISDGAEEHEWRRFVDAGALSVLLKLIIDSRDNIVIWAALTVLENVTRDQPECSAMALDQGIVTALAAIVDSDISEDAVQCLIQCLHNVLFHFPDALPVDVALSSYWPAIKKLLMYIDDYWIVLYAYRSLSIVTCGGIGDTRTQQAVPVGFVEDLIKIAKTTQNDLRLLALVLGSLGRACALHPQLAIDHGVLPLFSHLLSHDSLDRLPLATSIISTLASMSQRCHDLIAQMVKADLTPCIVRLPRCSDAIILYETTKALRNITGCEVDQHSLLIILEAVLPLLSEILTRGEEPKSSELIELVLSALANIVRASRQTNQCAAVWKSFKRTRLLHRLEDMQWDDNEIISERVVELTGACYNLLH